MSDEHNCRRMAAEITNIRASEQHPGHFEFDFRGTPFRLPVPKGMKSASGLPTALWIHKNYEVTLEMALEAK